VPEQLLHQLVEGGQINQASEATAMQATQNARRTVSRIDKKMHLSPDSQVDDRVVYIAPTVTARWAAASSGRAAGRRARRHTIVGSMIVARRQAACASQYVRFPPPATRSACVLGPLQVVGHAPMRGWC
jgi:hypothetical protein